MAKQHVFTRIMLKIGDKEIPVTNGMRLRFHLEYGLTYDGDLVVDGDGIPVVDDKGKTKGLSTDHYHVFDLESTVSDLCLWAKNHVIIPWQKALRLEGKEKVKTLFPRGSVISKDMVFPGSRTTVIKRELTVPEMIEKAKTDPEYREMLKEIYEGSK